MTTRKKAIAIWGKYDGQPAEQIDDAPDVTEAERLAAEYRLAYGAGWLIWIGSKSGKVNPSLRHRFKEDNAVPEKFETYLKWIRTALGEIDEHLRNIKRDPLAYIHRWAIIAKEFEAAREFSAFAKHVALNAAEQVTGERPKFPTENPTRVRGDVPEYSKLSLFTDLDRTLRGMAEWVEATIPERHRDREVAAMLAHISQHPEDVERGWPHVWKHARQAIDSGEFKLNPCGGEFTPRSSRVHWSKDPAKRKRQRKHIRESIAARSNPAPIPRVALLGGVVEVRTAKTTIRPRGAMLLVSEDGRTIVIARPTSRRAIASPSGGTSSKARGMYEKWSRFKSRRAWSLTVPARPLAHDLGAVLAIRYRSNKWTGKPTLYEHKFDGKATAIADAPRSPRMIRIDGVPPRVLVTERGIVG
jgi:hypothetical protein